MNYKVKILFKTESPYHSFHSTATSSDKFIGISTVMSWPEAQVYCRQHHTDLATSNSVTDNSLLTELVKGQWSAWFGLFRDTWKWSDQSNASSIDWMLGSPNNLEGNNNCGMFTVGYIVDAPCFNPLPFFCHTSESFCMRL